MSGTDKPVMIKCVKDISREAERELRALPPGAGYRFLGRPFEVRSNSSRLLKLVDDIYGAFRSPASLTDPVVTYLLEDGAERETPYRTIDPGFDSFLCSDPERTVSFWAAQLMRDHLFRLPLLFVHGAALEKSGGVFVFAGQSGAGKTTFILSLGGEGFSFFSDEFAPISLDGCGVHPFPRSLLLGREHLDRPAVPAELPFFLDYQEKNPGEPEPPRRFILGPEKVFPALGQEPVPPAAFCFLDGFSGTATAARPLEAGRALELLLKLAVNTGCLDSASGSRAVETLAGLLSRVPAYLIRPGPPDEVPTDRARAIGELAAGSPVGVGDLEQIARCCRQILEREKGSPLITRISTK